MHSGTAEEQTLFAATVLIPLNSGHAFGPRDIAEIAKGLES